MRLTDDCLLIPARLGGDAPDLASGGQALRLSSLLALRVIDHAHTGGDGLESSLVVAIGPGAAHRVGEIEDALAASGVDVHRGAARGLALRSCFDASKQEGDHYVAVQVDFVATKDDATSQEAEFDSWYTYEHMSDVSRADGFHRAFRGVATDEGPRHYWCWYETDDPAAFMDSRKGQAPWGGLWLPNIDQTSFRRSYFEISARWTKE